MRQLTPERRARSVIVNGAGVDEVDNMDFQLGPTEGLVINHVEGSITLDPDTEDGIEIARQYLLLDPDAVAGDVPPIVDGTDIDSGIIYEHVFGLNTGADDGAGGGRFDRKTNMHTRDYRHLPLEDRPKTIGNLTHIVDAGDSTGTHVLTIFYVLVVFTLEELGLLNAFRRF